MIKVLIVEDSRTVSQYLEFILESDPEIKVVGNVANGKEAVDFVNNNKPDIISMDIDMPIMNGLAATRIIMSTNPLPIVVVTASRNASNMDISIEAMASGALGVINKPLGIGHPNEEQKTKKLLSLIKAYSQVKVIKRKEIKPKPIIDQDTVLKKLTSSNRLPSLEETMDRKYLAIGLSSGGPQVLQKIFTNLSTRFPYPILVVQHITLGFLEGLVAWLGRTTDISICIAKNKESLHGGTVYFAPNGYQMEVKSNTVYLTKPTEEKGTCPSVKHMFNSLLPEAKKTIALILTGMGKDGAVELKSLKDAGALTIAQDKESSLIHGMPGEAIKLGGASYVMNVIEISELLQAMDNRSSIRQRIYNI